MKGILKLCAAPLALVLAGCATKLPERVLGPVPVYCEVAMPKHPVWATTGLPKDADIFVKVRALLAERRQRIAYQRQLEAAVAACNAPVSASRLAR